MMTNRLFRFGVVAAQARAGEEWAEKARHVEALGYATLVIPDNIQYTLAPLPALAVAAAATQMLRVGTYVLANDYRNPVLLAKEAATLDLLSSGRFELGIGSDAGQLARSGAVPVLTGRTDAMCDTLKRRRETLGISYIMVADELMDALAPVVERLAGR